MSSHIGSMFDSRSKSSHSELNLSFCVRIRATLPLTSAMVNFVNTKKSLQLRELLTQSESGTRFDR